MTVLHATNDVLTERGIELPLPPQATTTPDTGAEQGLAVQKQIVGAGRVDALYANACPPGEQHWHGASPDSFMEHLAMLDQADDPAATTTWLEHVSDTEYLA